MLVGLLIVGGCRHSPAAAGLDASLEEIRRQREQARLLNAEAMEQSAPDRRRTLLERAVNKDEMYGEARNNLGVVLYQLNQPYQAAVQLKRAADLMPGAAAPYANLAVLHASLHQWERAHTFAQKAHERNAQDPLTTRVLARSLIETNADRRQLVELLERMAVRDPSEPWREWAMEQARLFASHQPLRNR